MRYEQEKKQLEVEAGVYRLVAGVKKPSLWRPVEELEARREGSEECESTM